MFSTSSVLGRGVRSDVMGEEADKGEGEERGRGKSALVLVDKVNRKK